MSSQRCFSAMSMKKSFFYQHSELWELAVDIRGTCSRSLLTMFNRDRRAWEWEGEKSWFCRVKLLVCVDHAAFRGQRYLWDVSRMQYWMRKSYQVEAVLVVIKSFRWDRNERRKRARCSVNIITSAQVSREEKQRSDIIHVCKSRL